MTDFLERELKDDVLGDGIELGLPGSKGRRTSHGQVGRESIQAMPSGAVQEELRLQVLQV